MQELARRFHGLEGVGKKRLRRRLRSIERQVQIHEERIRAEWSKAVPNEGVIRHWESELRGYRDGVRRARKRLGNARRRR